MFPTLRFGFAWTSVDAIAARAPDMPANTPVQGPTIAIIEQKAGMAQLPSPRMSDWPQWCCSGRHDIQGV
jgi:hypothetical protein